MRQVYQNILLKVLLNENYNFDVMTDQLDEVMTAYFSAHAQCHDAVALSWQVALFWHVTSSVMHSSSMVQFSPDHPSRQVHR